MKYLINLSLRVLNRLVRPLICPRPKIARLTFRLLTALRAVHLYQPIPWLGFTEGLRAVGTEARWHAIRAELSMLDATGTAMDLGSQLGYFSLRMAESNWLCLAVEANKSTHHAALLVQRATGIENVAYRNMSIDSQTVERLPRVDVVIFLSLWHHLCGAEGYEKARDILKSVLQRTNHVCIFETGQSNEQYMSWATSLPPMEPDPQTWLINLLKECGAHDVQPLGQFETFLGPIRREMLAAYTRPRMAAVDDTIQAAGVQRKMASTQ